MISKPGCLKDSPSRMSDNDYAVLFNLMVECEINLENGGIFLLFFFRFRSYLAFRIHVNDDKDISAVHSDMIYTSRGVAAS